MVIPFFWQPSAIAMATLCLTHECLDFVLEPLKIGTHIGIMTSDPLGNLWHTYTACAAYMVDTQEVIMLSGVAGKTSHLTLARYKQFGDAFWHPPCTTSITLNQLQKIYAAVDPLDLNAYMKEALNYWQIDKPFWRDWAGADPSVFFTPKPLHHWHKAFWDHNVKWCIHAVGAEELDFRFSILPHHVGFQQFKEGISKLKQVTGQEHHNVECYMVCVIEGVVTKDFLIATQWWICVTLHMLRRSTTLSVAILPIAFQNSIHINMLFWTPMLK